MPVEWQLEHSFHDILCHDIDHHPVHWVQSVPHARTACKTRLPSVLGVSPCEMLHGCKPCLAVPIGVQLDLTDVGGPQVDVEDRLAGLQQAFDMINDTALQGISKQFDSNMKYWAKNCSELVLQCCP